MPGGNRAGQHAGDHNRGDDYDKCCRVGGRYSEEHGRDEPAQSNRGGDSHGGPNENQRQPPPQNLSQDPQGPPWNRPVSAHHTTRGINGIEAASV